MLKKLFITPYFGEFPSWIEKYNDNRRTLEQYGYEWFTPTDEEEFKKRIKDTLGITAVITQGESFSHNYRTAFGAMYQDKLKDYDYWGITDFDCVYGNIPHFLPDTELEKWDIHSNHHNYICGPWTLFRNTDKINNLYQLVPQWGRLMTEINDHPGRWTEIEYSQIVDREHEVGNIKRLYTHYQGLDPNDDSELSYVEGSLYDHGTEIMMFHCNRKKRWPL